MDDYSFLNPVSSYSDSLTGFSSQATNNVLLKSLEGLANQTSQGGSNTDFKDLLTVMLLGMTMQGSNSNSFGSSSSESDNNFMGSSFSSLMAPMMLNLLEQILAKDTRDNTSDSTTSSGNSSKAGTLLEAAQGYQINQFDGELQVGGDGINANCGPTSLTIALHALGMRVNGETADTSPGRAIELARMSMVTDPARDGVDAQGNRVDSEQNTFTNFQDLMNGAQAAGARPQLLETNAESVRAALANGGKVVVCGTFVGKSPLPWTGDRGSDNQGAPGNATKHLVAITGYDAKTGTFILNDPARKTPLAITASALENFMAGNAGAMALYRS